MPSTTDQNVRNLKEANRIRILRAQLRGELKQLDNSQGRFLLADAIEDMPDWLEGADIHRLLTLCPYRGSLGADVWADRLLARMMITTPRRRLASLSPRQRILIAKALRTPTQGSAIALVEPIAA